MPQLEPFKLERFFALHEFKVRYLLSASDCESLSMAELLALADDDSLARWQRLGLGYTESQGDPALREAVAVEYRTLSPDDVLVLVPEEGIYIAMQTLVGPGDHVVAVAPAYQSLYGLAQARGCQVTRWPARLSPVGWAFDLAELGAAIRPNTRLLVINFPHNPTGHLASLAELQDIVDLAHRHGLYLFSDEMYRGLEYDPAHKLPAVADIYERGISLAGLSKTHAVPGLRLGWLATRQADLLARWMAYKDYTTICHSAPSEALGLMALRAGPHILRRNIDIILANLAHADAFFARHPDSFTWPRPQAGSVAFPAWSGDTDALSQRVLDHEGVMLLPGSIFDAPPDTFRLGLGRRNFPEALERLERCL